MTRIERKRHELKTIPPYFQDVLEGRKTFEVRENDRGFQEGDELWLREFVPTKGYTGRSITKRVTYLLDFDDHQPPPWFGLADGYCVMGLAPVEWRSAGVYGDDVPGGFR